MNLTEEIGMTLPVGTLLVYHDNATNISILGSLEIDKDDTDRRRMKAITKTIALNNWRILIWTKYTVVTKEEAMLFMLEQ